MRRDGVREDTFREKRKAEYFSLPVWTGQIALKRRAKFLSAREAFRGVLNGRRRGDGPNPARRANQSSNKVVGYAAQTHPAGPATIAPSLVPRTQRSAQAVRCRAGVHLSKHGRLLGGSRLSGASLRAAPRPGHGGFAHPTEYFRACQGRVSTSEKPGKKKRQRRTS